MLIRERLAHKRPVFSFEFFPPKTEKGEQVLWRSLEQLAPLAPDFVSVTYGAGGSTRARTLELVGRIKRELGWKPAYEDLDVIVDTAYRWRQHHPDGYRTSEPSGGPRGYEG